MYLARIPSMQSSLRRYLERGLGKQRSTRCDSNALMPNLHLLSIQHLHTTGLHFNLPCVETHEIVDMRTITLGVPPQEVHTLSTLALQLLPPPSLLLPALLYMS